MKYLFLGLAFSLAAGSAGAATVQNGGFESPGTFSGSFQTINAGSAALTGWSIDIGSVDLINTYWQSGSCSYSLDLSGNAEKSIGVSIGGDSRNFSFDTTGNSRASMGWTLKSLDFTAGADSLVLRFSALDAGPFGPALDDVAISAIPLPAGAPLLLAGLGALALTRRRARRRATA